VDASQAADVAVDGRMADLAVPRDVADAAVLADAALPGDVPITSDVADATPSIDVVIPVDRVSAIDVVAPVDGVTLADTSTPMDLTRADLIHSGDAGLPCVKDTDCTGTGDRCGYLIADACSATGTCVTAPAGAPCGAIVSELGCGCDGTTVHWAGGCHPDFPDGYAPAALSHTGACP